MLVARGVIGGMLLFLGRELNFLFSAAMAAWIALRLTPLLPLAWQRWTQYAFIAALALFAAAVTLLNRRAGYFLTGFLVGSAFLVEYYEPGVLTLPVLPFLVGGAIGSIVLGLFTEWALMIVSCLVGAYFITSLFLLSPTAKILVGSGLFLIGALAQVGMKQMLSADE